MEDRHRRRRLQSLAYLSSLPEKASTVFLPFFIFL
jgi:hypothetical protein